MMTNCVVLDVTSFISAEEFILSQNRSSPAPPRDPFAQQCYAELVQSLIYFDQVLVPHPVLLDPKPVDYGRFPRILQHLFALGIVAPLSIRGSESGKLADAEHAALETLKTTGVATLQQFVDKTRAVDAEVERQGGSQLLAKIASWAEFQATTVRNQDHHGTRIAGTDGIENDPFGRWARSSSFAIEGQLRTLAPDSEQQLWITATLVRSLRYSARAKVKSLAYTPHPLRRDFSVMFDLFDDGAPDNAIEDVIRKIRGIPNEIQRIGGSKYGKLQLLEYQLPLLGGRLWSLQDRGKHSDERWLELACGRIQEYRERAVDFRRVLARCDTAEEALRLELDIDHVRDQLLDRLGLAATTPNETELSLIDSVASVAEWGTGLPLTKPFRLAYGPIKRHTRSFEAPHQKFLYREFVRGL